MSNFEQVYVVGGPHVIEGSGVVEVEGSLFSTGFGGGGGLM